MTSSWLKQRAAGLPAFMPTAIERHQPLGPASLGRQSKVKKEQLHFHWTLKEYELLNFPTDFSQRAVARGYSG